jgi:tetratricopeptide (TPR) repeat protein
MKTTRWLSLAAWAPLALLAPAQGPAPALAPQPPAEAALLALADAAFAAPAPPALAPQVVTRPPKPPKAPVPPPPPPPGYQTALDYINSAKYQMALAKLQALDARSAGGYADAALYWRAYAESRLGRSDRALQLLARLKSDYANSAWQPDAAALALELRQASGEPVSPATQNNDDLKLLAINGLMQTSPAQALPLLQKVVSGNASLAVKRRALFVLAQTHSPAAIAELSAIARRKGEPMISQDAVRYLGMMGGESGRAALAKLYVGASPAMKEDILRGYFLGGDRARLLTAAKTETNPEVRSAAIRDLALAGGRAQLAQLYAGNLPVAARSEIIHALAIGGGADQLLPLARAEKNPQLRLEAIRALGWSNTAKVQQALVSLYAGAANRTVSDAVIEALFVHNNAPALVALAKKETDPALKRDLVQRLSLMHNPAATAYLMDLLNH